MRLDYFGRVSSKGLENVSRFPHLVAELVRLGFYERDILKITAGNLRCVLRRVEAIGGQLRWGRRVLKLRTPGVRRPY
jgi:membrane dipeptidase